MASVIHVVREIYPALFALARSIAACSSASKRSDCRVCPSFDAPLAMATIRRQNGATFKNNRRTELGPHHTAPSCPRIERFGFSAAQSLDGPTRMESFEV